MFQSDAARSPFWLLPRQSFTKYDQCMAPYGAPSFLKQLAPQIVAEIQPPAELKKFTDNTDIIGDYVEAGVRQFVRRYLSPIRVSTGGVIDQDQEPGGYIPQLDTIVWIPGPVSAIFEVADFGLVPRSSCLGILEIKSSAYTGVVGKLKDFTDPKFAHPITAPIDQQTREVQLRTVFPRECFAMGVISVLQENQSHPDLQQLRDNGRIAVLFKQTRDQFEPQTKDIYNLVNFLMMLRFRAASRDGLMLVWIDTGK
jgi:hypothetical protein